MSVLKMKDKYKSGNYICVAKSEVSIDWYLCTECILEYYYGIEYKLIHKNHKEILDAYLKNKHTKICYKWHDEAWMSDDTNFIDMYEENAMYTV